MRSSRSPLYYTGDKIMEVEKRANINNDDFREMSTSNRGSTVKPEGAPAKRAVVVEKSNKAAAEDINESAEAFIRKFRQQLVIQRLESIENFESMLARGT
ncbi:hypothetical protein LguiA_028579 [Lonicera macranthoides]